jgi:hypothetical protein
VVVKESVAVAGAVILSVTSAVEEDSAVESATVELGAVPVNVIVAVSINCDG